MLDEVKKDENGNEITTRVEDKIIHLFKMKAEKMDHLMTLEQWRLMKENHEKEEPKEIVVEDIDDKELKKMNLGYQKPLLKPDNEEKKEK